MTKDARANNDIVLDFMSEQFVYEVMRQDIRVRKMLLKGGFGDWLLVITARKDGEPVVCFVGSSSILGVARKLLKLHQGKKLVWKTDKYADKD